MSEINEPTSPDDMRKELADIRQRHPEAHKTSGNPEDRAGAVTPEMLERVKKNAERHGIMPAEVEQEEEGSGFAPDAANDDLGAVDY